MNIRIALLVIGSLMGGGSSAAWADAMKPLDPDQAPIAAVDRFSDKAATIYMRTADDRLPGHLPGPNEPVDFDTGPFITQGLSPRTGKPVRYYNFDIQSTPPAPVYVLHREGEDKPVGGQLDIIDTLPGEKGYVGLTNTGLSVCGVFLTIDQRLALWALQYFPEQDLVLASQLPPSFWHCSWACLSVSPAKAGTVKASARVTTNTDIKVFMTFLLCDVYSTALPAFWSVYAPAKTLARHRQRHKKSPLVMILSHLSDSVIRLISS